MYEKYTLPLPTPSACITPICMRWLSTVLDSDITVITAATAKNINGSIAASDAIVSFMLSNAATDGKLSRSRLYMYKPAGLAGFLNISVISSADESENLPNSSSLSSISPITFTPVNTSMPCSLSAP